ncbi:MAG: VCBS repeat-containing protein, partial [Planctomycetes bacterium]|nr:VCBS repeat-containing protein [Planctomycetota bacterium]
MIRFRSLGVFVALSFALAPSAPSQTQFQERSLALGLVHETTVGLDRVGQLKNMLDWVQTGAAMGDLDGNGWPDLIVCGRFEGTRLFMNQGGFFTDSTATSGLASDELDNSVTLGDYDGDGDLDAFIGVHGPLGGPIPRRGRLLRNDGNAHFEGGTGAHDTRGG